MKKKYFQARFVKILIIPRAPNFTSTPFDCQLISWLTNYPHNRGILACLSHRELQALKSLKHTVWLLKVPNFS